MNKREKHNMKTKNNIQCEKAYFDSGFVFQI